MTDTQTITFKKDVTITNYYTLEKEMNFEEFCAAFFRKKPHQAKIVWDKLVKQMEEDDEIEVAEEDVIENNYCDPKNDGLDEDEMWGTDIKDFVKKAMEKKEAPGYKETNLN